MDSFEFTKIAGAVLSALLLIFGTKVLIEMNTGHGPAKPGYTLPAAETKTAEANTAEGGDKAAQGDKAAAPAAGGGSITALLAKANADNGKSLFSKCKACHNIEKGKPKLVGPNLWGVVNRAKGSVEGFDYSAGMKAKGGNWTFEDLAAFIHKPGAFIQGTKMVFNGFPNDGDVADVIAYLAAQADTPVALPK